MELRIKIVYLTIKAILSLYLLSFIKNKKTITMKNVLKFLPFYLMLTLVVFSCKDDDEPESCITDPAVTVEENIIGTWTINGEALETVTFKADGTGSSSEEAFQFAASNNDKDYHNFGWEMEDEVTVVITHDYSPDTPIVPYIISVDYTVLTNECDRIETESGFASSVILTR